ncbi:Uma2 family endonuclease [Fibrella sp. HMF5335]|uniref:Uma2 family endonuclease n=1 Tax=Fibrella rubiginis TaxID=2817060 RepID=A0A939GCW8_9BACT|nr:Uma2 family endonuclease [Fibrella rubiginis]MBO0934934.1 Uma2 family endonuclease [Fibrella rubiginis]
MLTVETLLQAPNLRSLLDETEKAWQDEQRRRHEFWADADEGVKAEFILGEIIYHSPVYGRHWMASTNITRRLLPFVYDNRLGMVGYKKVMVRMTRNDYEPDICFWNDDIASSFGQKQSAFPSPDFIVEILSDSTKDRDYGVKMTDYALHGVREYWIVDVDNEAIEQYLLSGTEFTLAQKLKDGTLAAEAIPGFAIAVKDVFAFGM